MSDELMPKDGFKDPKWSDYVVSQLTDDEMIEGAPKTDGLLRLVEQLIGTILSIDSHVVQAPCPDNMGRATVLVTMLIKSYNESIEVPLKYSSAADVCSRNADAPYNQYPVALAGTRALGRCCRLALRLKTATAEEKSVNAEYASEIDETGDKITEAQIGGINNLCKKLNINIKSFVNMGNTQYKTIHDVSLSTAVKMLKRLNEYRNEEAVVEAAIVGYDTNWKSEFTNK